MTNPSLPSAPLTRELPVRPRVGAFLRLFTRSNLADRLTYRVWQAAAVALILLAVLLVIVLVRQAWP